MALIIKRTIYLFAFLFVSHTVFSQKDSVKHIEPLKATANFQITNNGLSLFPNLSFGKPAAIINASIGKKNIYFEPELRWGLNLKPWSYIFWLRYKYRKSEKFGVNIGTHPSYVIRETAVTINGVADKRYVAQRYLAGEIIPTYYFSKKFAFGIHYLYSKGLDNYATQNSHFLSFQPRFSNLKVVRDYYLNFNPQIFHLILDDKEGTYVSEMLSLNKKDSPFYISSTLTYKIKSTIPGDDFVWNIGLNVKF